MDDEQTNFAEIPSAAPETLHDDQPSQRSRGPAVPRGLRDLRPEPSNETAESQAVESSESNVESRLDQKIRETESRLLSQFEQMIARVNQSNRDATKARFDELKAYFDQLYFVKAEGLDELVQSHQLDPTAAALQKLAWRERYDKEALHRAQAMAQGSSAAEAERARFEKRVALILDEYDLSMSDPEYQSDIASKPLGNDPDEAEFRLRKMAKQAAKKKEARLSGVPSEERRKEEPRSPARAPMLVDSGVSQRVPPLERKPKPTLEDADDLGAAILRKFTKKT